MYVPCERSGITYNAGALSREGEGEGGESFGGRVRRGPATPTSRGWREEVLSNNRSTTNVNYYPRYLGTYLPRQHPRGACDSRHWHRLCDGDGDGDGATSEVGT